MWEKLLGAGSLGGSISHLAHCQTTFLTSSNALDLASMVQIVAPAFLGYWALIALAFVTHFQQDDYLILLEVVAQVETNTSLFQMAL
jgi:hypothetical protein